MESKIQYYDWAYNIDIIFFFYCDNSSLKFAYNLREYDSIFRCKYRDILMQYLDVNTESVGRVTLQ